MKIWYPQGIDSDENLVKKQHRFTPPTGMDVHPEVMEYAAVRRLTRDEQCASSKRSAPIVRKIFFECRPVRSSSSSFTQECLKNGLASYGGAECDCGCEGDEEVHAKLHAFY